MKNKEKIFGPQDPKLETQKDIGRLALEKIDMSEWWTKSDNIELPTYGAEMLGEDF